MILFNKLKLNKNVDYFLLNLSDIDHNRIWQNKLHTVFGKLSIHNVQVDIDLILTKTSKNILH